MVRWFRAAAAAVALAVIAACTPAATSTPAPTTTTSAQPTYLCTAGTQTASPFPCDKARYDEQQKTKALEDEAKAVYERYWKELNSLLLAGGAEAPTAEYLATLEGPMLGNAMVVPKYLKDKGWVAKPLVASVRVAVLPSAVRADAEISLVVCEDLTGTAFVDRSGQQAGGGHLGVQNLALKRFGASLKIYDSVGGGNTCPIG